MYTHSVSRQASVAAILVAAMAGIIVASIGDGLPTARLSAAPAVAEAGYPEALPQLPEVVVTAPRLASR